MSTTIDYKGKKDPKKAALADIAWWFGAKWPEVEADLKAFAANPKRTWREWCMMLEFAGVRGYPVRILWEHYGRTTPTEA